MDLSQYDLTANAEKGFDYVVKDPISGKATDATVTVMGSDSKAYRRIRNEITREVARSGKDIDADDLSCRIYAECITGWSGLSDGKGLIEYSKEAASKLMNDLPWLMDQIGLAVEKRANFTVKPATK